LGLDIIGRNEWDHDRSRGLIVLVIRVASVVFVLADLEAAGAAEHYVNDADVTDHSADPLGGVMINAETRNKNTRPIYHFAEVVRAAHEAEKPGTNELAGIFFLGAVFLEVGGRFKNNAESGDYHAGDAERVSSAVVHKPEPGRRSLKDVEESNGDPDRKFDTKGNFIVGLDFAFHAAIVGGFHVAVDQISGQTDAVDDE